MFHILTRLDGVALNAEDTVEATMAKETTEAPTGTAAALKTVVVATDFSTDGNQAVRRAIQLSLAPEAHLILTHVLPRRLDKTVDSLVRSAAERELDSLATMIGDDLVEAGRSDVRVTVRLARGHPAEEIDLIADSNGADLIAVGRRGHSQLRRFLIGSTASRLVRRGRHPVLVATGASSRSYERVVLGHDLSESALAAARLLQRAVEGRLQITVVHAFEQQWRGLPPALLVDAPIGELRLSEEAMTARAQEIRNALKPVWPRDAYRLVVEEADPRQFLLDTAQETMAHLLVMGSRGLTGLARVALGSVSELVLQEADCDVLVVPAVGHRAG